MKSRIVLLLFFMFSFVIAKANTDPEPAPTCGKGKKESLVGTVIHSDSKKPLKDVNVTAYLVSKKEKAIVTDDDGTFTFGELKPGVYKLVFEKAGYKKITKEKVVIKTDESFQLNIEMIESSGAFELLPSPLHFTDF
jgi:5-hydroxyisourate hydrolase-like protein (transthyretin family)